METEMLQKEKKKKTEIAKPFVLYRCNFPARLKRDWKNTFPFKTFLWNWWGPKKAQGVSRRLKRRVNVCVFVCCVRGKWFKTNMKTKFANPFVVTLAFFGSFKARPEKWLSLVNPLILTRAEEGPAGNLVATYCEVFVCSMSSPLIVYNGVWSV